MSLVLPPLPSIRDILKLYRLNAIKHLSQNFLLKDDTLNKIVKQAGKIKDGHVVEVGPGPGGITRTILRKLPRRLTVIERDRRFEPVMEMLAESFAMVNGKMDIMFKDVLLTDMSVFLEQELKRNWEDNCPNIHIIGNLPFNISTPLIVKWLKAISERSNAWSMGRVQMTLTFQKEVAERLVAPPRTPARCRLSAMAQTWTEPKLKFIIPGSEFVPAPDVDVGVVTFTPLVKPFTNHKFDLYEKVVRQLFSFRKKYSIRSAETLFPPEYHKSLVPLMYKLAEVNPETRAMQLTVEELNRICSAYEYLCQQHPIISLYEYRASRRILSTKYTEDFYIHEITDEENNGELGKEELINQE